MGPDYGMSDNTLQRLALAYRTLLRLSVATLPLGVALYLHAYQDPSLLFQNHLFHEVAIALATILGGFIAWVSFVCYQRTGERFAFYVTLALAGFTIVYAPHGLLTRTADETLWLFILFGPASRLLMAGLLVVAALHYGTTPPPGQARAARGVWLAWGGVFLAVVVVTGAWASSPLAANAPLRMAVEGGAAVLFAVAAVILLLRRSHSALTWTFIAALLFMTQSSLVFLVSKPWNHLWWAAHAALAAGFFVISYGIIRAFAVAQAFSAVYDDEEMIARLAEARAETRMAKRSAEQLRALAETSPIGILVVAEDEDQGAGALLLVNPTLRDLLGLPQGAADNDPAFLPPLLPALTIDKPGRPEELRLSRSDGAEVWCVASMVPVEFGGHPARVIWLSDITATKDREYALRAAVEQADMASRAKSEFLATMSHELRTPLNAIIGFSDTMRSEIMGPLGDARYKGYSDNIHESGLHLLELINDILDVAAIESGKVELGEEEANPAQLLSSCLRLIRPRAEKGRLTLVSSVPEALPLIRTDKRRFKQVVLNILSNAVKFTPKGGTITLEARLRHPSQELELTVRDTGVGMTPEELPIAFATFGRVQSAWNSRQEGSGLGLPLSKSLIEAMGGHLSLHSVKGEGTTVVITLPLQEPEP